MHRRGARVRRLGHAGAFRFLSGIAVVLVAACGGDATGPPGPTQLAFSSEPTDVVAGATMSPVTVEVRDANGNRVTTGSYAIIVSLARNQAGARVAGTLTQAAVNGVATFSDLRVTVAASGYLLQATATPLAGATSTPFTVTPAAPAQLAFTVEPSDEASGQPIAPPVAVAIEDGYGNTVTTATNTVTVALGNNPGAATLSGMTSVAAVGGVATFSTLTINTIASGYTLSATSNGLFGAASVPFCVATSNTGICYHGGAIIDSQKVAALYWSPAVIYLGGPTPGTSDTTGKPVGDGSIVGFFLRNLGGSPYFNINTTYYDRTNTHVLNVVTYTQYWADPSSPPDTTDGALQREIEAGFTAGKLVYNAKTLYVVFTGSGANPGGGFGTQYCAYHGYFIDTQNRYVKYAAMPYMADDYRHCSALMGSPNNDPPADAVVNVLAHEIEETTTDGNLDAWYNDANQYENGDLCAWQFGTTYTTSNGATANQRLGSLNPRDFLVQMNWVNASQTSGAPVGCAQHWP